MSADTEEDELNDLEIIVLDVLLQYGFKCGDYQLNIFPSNSKVFEKVVDFISGVLNHSGPLPLSETIIPDAKKRLKSKGLIIYYLSEKLNNRRIIKIPLNEIAKYKEQILSRMRCWGQQFGSEIDNRNGNYNEAQIFDVPEYIGHEENILH